MCGIGGGISFRSQVFDSPAQQIAFAEPMRYRGPDAEGFWEEAESTGPQVTLIHKRLSIIDLSPTGNQPMHSNTGRSHIVLNGEIYNYQALKKELPDYPFQSQSDTEVLLAGYEAWGFAELLQKMKGMFALALYDTQQQALYLARDPFGKKPLYYLHQGPTFYFSSDLRSFNSLPYTYTPDVHSLGYYFQELSSPRTNTPWKEIKKLPEGHWATFSHSGFQAHPYFQIQYQVDASLSYQDALDQTDALLTQAVQRRLVADVSIGALLSGGIDSSLVVAKMAEVSPEPINTYSVGFAEAAYNELPYAKQVAEKYGTRHTELMVSYEDLESAQDLIWEYGEPFADLSMVPTYLVSKAVGQNHKVLLGGDGGDELFAGYYIHHLVAKLMKFKNLAPLQPLVKLMSRVSSHYQVQFLNTVLTAAREPRYKLLNRKMGIMPSQLARMMPEVPVAVQATDREHQAVWEAFGSFQGDTLQQVISSTLHTRLVNDYLVKVDRASMYCSIEMRSPFMDVDLAHFAATIPTAYHTTPNGTKSLLRELSKKYLPQNLTNREKQGFSVPAQEWLKEELSSLWRETVLGGRQSLIPMNYEAVEAYYQDHHQGKGDHTLGLWALYAFHIWAQRQT
ncbi:MAG: asparagine synthase (glutamine-hydrolyzing) [Bacteroidota bacterium]